MAKLLTDALTAASAPATKEQPICIATWAKWLSLETFNDPQLEAMVERCAKWANRYKAGLVDVLPECGVSYYRGPQSWLSLLGKTGTGKTKCARCLFQWANSKVRAQPSDFTRTPIYWPAMVRNLRFQHEPSYNILVDCRNWPVLMIDDIGAERDTTGFAAEQLNTLLGCRVGKWTIITSNLTLEQLGGIDPRIPDRMIREPGNQWIEVETISYGVRKASGVA